MLRMIVFSVRSFFQGKLFRDYGVALRQWLKGFLLTLGVLVVVGYFVNPLTGIIVASLLGGLVQPYLFRHIKYA